MTMKMNSGHYLTSINNPWTESLDNCHLWCCPECDFKAKTKELLIHHGVLQHPLVS